MDDNWISTVLPSNMTKSGGNQTEINADLNGVDCMHVTFIPGIASIDTVQGLNDFSNSYGGIHGYVAVAVCLFGVLSNSANIVVLTRKNMASSTNTILLWLAVADLLTMVDYLPFAIHFYVMEPADATRQPFSTPEFSWICFLLFHASFSIVCHTIAIWLTIALAIFRYIFICKPTRGSYYCSQQRACYVVVTVIILTIVLCIPNYTINTYQFHHTANETFLINISTESYYYPDIRMATPEFKMIFLVNNWVQAILIKLVPCFMLVTLTLLLLNAMHNAYRKRLKLKSQGRRAESDKHGEHNRTTGMLLAVVILFTITELPQGILTLMNIFVDCFTTTVYYKLGDLLDIMALINNSVNFVLYCTMSKQFRTTFASIFCPRQSSHPKWLKLRLIKSKGGDLNSIEISEGSKKYVRSNKNGGVRMNNECQHLSQEPTVSELIFDDPTEITDVQVSNEKLLLAAESNNGVSAHAHGLVTDHSCL
ncbi:unnamed protein product [Candidula unifasciata]|uniref:G-protein coupled receptors family 1 profile domain-containing protein n=1 Tax=Candidula unifasciata TaxID=100452 RepID=A0A8S3Z5K8_9EUPU|nr:unnamed protein product [Candidula unifasciata]